MFFTRQCHGSGALCIIEMAWGNGPGCREGQLQLPAASLLWAAVKWVSSHSSGQDRRGLGEATSVHVLVSLINHFHQKTLKPWGGGVKGRGVQRQEMQHTEERGGGRKRRERQRVGEREGDLK